MHKLVATVPSSPSWHRRFRSSRAKARKRVRKAKTLGHTASSKDILRLERHHTVPLLRVKRPRLLTDTSRRSSNMPQWSWPAYSPQQPFYKAPWKKGAGKAENQHAKGSAKGQAKGKQRPEHQDWSGGKGADNNRFPKYDQIRTQPQAIMEIASTSSATTADDLLVKELQRCVNLARKAEQKVTGLQKQIQTKQQQWESFQAEIKQTFLKEQGRFHQDLHRLNVELSAAEASQAEARAVVRSAARGESIMDPQAESDKDQQWLQQVQSWEQAGGPQEELPTDAVLRRALEAATAKPYVGQAEFSTPLRPTKTGITTPLTKKGNGRDIATDGSLPNLRHPAPTRPADAVDSSNGGASVMYFGGLPSPPASADPYLMAAPTRPTPKSAVAPRKPVSKSPDGVPRTAIKEHGRAKAPLHTPSPSLSLAKKLEARRRALGEPSDVAGTKPPENPPLGSSVANHLLYDDEDPPQDAEDEGDSDLEISYNNHIAGPQVSAGDEPHRHGGGQQGAELLSME